MSDVKIESWNVIRNWVHIPGACHGSKQSPTSLQGGPVSTQGQSSWDLW